MEQTGLRVDSDANHSTRLLFIITYKNLQRALTSYLIVPFYPLHELLEISWQKVSSLLPERFLGFLIFD